jgi:hypothetical protein
MLVRSREALRCFPFLHRCHTIGPRHRFRLCQTQEAHISADGFARGGGGLRLARGEPAKTGLAVARKNSIASLIFIGPLPLSSGSNEPYWSMHG